MQNTLKIKRTKTALAFNLAIIACEIAAICSLLSGYKIKYSRHTKVNLERDWLFLF